MAFKARRKIGLVDNSHTNTFRLVHGEGDNLPGLIIDIYDEAAIIQAHTIGMHRLRETIMSALKKNSEKIKVIYDKSSETLSRSSGVNSNSFLEGELKETIVKENDIQFKVNWVEGQKTGFFLDQRDNRSLIQKYSKGKKVLNAFSYSGGFSMYALKGNSTFVHSVDSSAKAVALCDENAALNGFSERHKSFDSDVFDFLKSSQEKYDIIILDPPAFAKHLSAVENAMVGYRNLNTEGIKRVAPGGLVFTFSCSQVIDRILFRKVVFQAAAQAKRNVRILHQLNQAADHPINIFHPEGEYLKGLVLLVD